MVCLREVARARLSGSRESTTGVPEQLSLGQFRRDGTAVEADERAFRTAALRVKERADELLARSCFTADEHRDLLRRHPGGRVEQMPHGGGIRHDPQTDGMLDGELPALEPQNPRLERSLECGGHLVHVEGLRDVLVGAGLDGADGQALGIVRGEENHRKAFVALVYDPQESHAVHLRHGEIGHHGIRSLNELEGLRPRAREERLPASTLHELLQCGTNRRLVIHEQHARHRPLR